MVVGAAAYVASVRGEAMRVRRYDAECIPQYGRSRATLDATECRDWASIRPVSPQGTPWSSILA